MADLETRGLSSGGSSLGESAFWETHSPGWMTGRPKRTRPCLTAQASQFPDRSGLLLKHDLCQAWEASRKSLNSLISIEKPAPIPFAELVVAATFVCRSWPKIDARSTESSF